MIRDHVLLPFASSVADADARLAPRLGASTLDPIIDAIPTEWLRDSRFDGPEAERDAYRRYLSERLAARPTWVAEADRVREELGRDAA